MLASDMHPTPDALALPSTDPPSTDPPSTDPPSTDPLQLVRDIPALAAEAALQVRAAASPGAARRQVHGLLLGAGLIVHGPACRRYFAALGQASRALAESLAGSLAEPGPTGSSPPDAWSDDAAPEDRWALKRLMIESPTRYLGLYELAVHELRARGQDEVSREAERRRFEAAFIGALLARGHQRSPETWRCVQQVMRSAMAAAARGPGRREKRGPR